MKVRELVAKHEIRYDAKQLVVDDRTADAVFEAGIDLLADIGLYHMETQRTVRYDRDELRTLARESKAKPANVTLGRGSDTMTLRHRTGRDASPPTNYAGAPTVADEAWFVEYVQSFAQEPSVAGIGIPPGLAKLGDLEPKAGTLSEVAVGLWEQNALREALRRAGRPDMNLGLLGTVSTVGGTLAMMGPALREAWNTQIGIHILPEQKLDWSRLLLAQYCQDRGIEPWQSAMSCIGLCRDGADTVAEWWRTRSTDELRARVDHEPFPSHLDGTGRRASHWPSGAASRRASVTGLAVGSISGDVKTWRAGLLWRRRRPPFRPSVLLRLDLRHTGLEAPDDEMMKAATRLSPEEANARQRSWSAWTRFSRPSATDLPGVYDSGP
jgi:hypothetical protein